MKGQFIAVEAVMSLGIGLIVALGILTAFTAFQGSIMDDVERAQINSVESEISVALMQIGSTNVSYGEVSLDLPETLGDRSYQLNFENGSLYILSSGEQYRSTFENLNNTYRFTGSASGGEVSILKEGNNLIISDSG
ncbi:hypothetical protein [Candidatus Nanohalovita haloferacivicina]|uniref:hypothetical protein n=1 Tax=Candidatus Nanohalovita haloferacivicina TaxID=2978046 RepID=UPI00325FCA2C|nr:hypothetical protein HBNXNv_0384 [Candidatus Nanohalobia archaeon BNXNv]